MQGDLFGNELRNLPAGFRYFRNAVPQAMQDALLSEISGLPFKAFDFHGFEGKRRVVSYGWRYDFDAASLRKSDDVPVFLFPLRELAAGFAGLPAKQLQQVLVTEYDIGSPIGWHRDKGVFGVVVGISLLSSCTFRLRRKIGLKWERVSITRRTRFDLCAVRAGEGRLGATHSSRRASAFFDYIPRTGQQLHRLGVQSHRV